MDELQDMVGFHIGGTNISNIRFADDTVLMTDTEVKLQRLVDGLNKACQRNRMKINLKKTEVMGVTERSERQTASICLG